MAPGGPTSACGSTSTAAPVVRRRRTLGSSRLRVLSEAPGTYVFDK